MEVLEDSGLPSQAIYPRLLRRIRAILIDSVILMSILFLWWITLPLFVDMPPTIKIGPLMILLFILDPLMVSITGGTPGHHLMGIRIQSAGSGNSINIVRAILRTVLKALLGWLSLLIVLTSKKHQALHDLVLHTVVVLKDPDALPESEKFEERYLKPAGYEYPPKWRRTLMILVYILVGLILLVMANLLFMSHECIQMNQCSTLDALIPDITSFIWFMFSASVIVLCWRGTFPGCRRKVVGKTGSCE